MILTESVRGLDGTTARDFHLLGANGQHYCLDSFAQAQALVVIFMCNHCPYVLAVKDRLNQLAAEFGPKGVQFVGINSNDSENYPEDSYEKMQEFGLNFPYLHDPEQLAATAYHAVCTPDIFVYDATRRLKYHGRIDDSWQHPEQVTKRELAEALTKILAGENIPREEQKPSMGCSIKWKK